MTRTVTIAAVVALLTSAAAYAQTEPPSPDTMIAPAPNMPTTQQPIEVPPPPAAEPDFDAPVATQDDEAEGDDARGQRREWRRSRMARDGWRHHGGHHGMGYRGHRHHGWGDFGDDRTRGARFTFSQGDGSPSVTIKCADGDTTLECANAVMPMLDRFLPPQPAGTTAP